MQNKTTILLKEAILQAAAEAGGTEGLVGYLKSQAIKNPSAFLPLVGKVLPLEVTGADGGPLTIITGVQRLAEDEREQERLHDERNGAPLLELKAHGASHANH